MPMTCKIANGPYSNLLFIKTESGIFMSIIIEEMKVIKPIIIVGL